LIHKKASELPFPGCRSIHEARYVELKITFRKKNRAELIKQVFILLNINSILYPFLYGNQIFLILIN